MRKLNIFVPKNEALRHKTGAPSLALSIKALFSNAIIRREVPALDRLPMVTISYVKMSQDKRNISVYFVTFNDENCAEAEVLLNNNVHFFKNLIAKSLKVRVIPSIRFVYDDTLLEAEKVESLLRTL